MEEPPTQESRPQANREVPRSRPSRATFSTPEPTTPTTSTSKVGSTAAPASNSRPAERAPRRAPASKPAPAVTFQPPPSGDDDIARGPAAAPKKPAKAAPTQVAKAASTQAGKATPIQARPTEAAPNRTTKGRKAAPRAATVPAQGVEPALVKAAPAKRAPRKAAKAAAVPAQQSLPLPLQAASEKAVSEQAAPERAVPEQTAPDPTEPNQVARYDWASVLGDPGHLPELLALAAVETIGPRAQLWATRVRESYPSATPQGIARLAVAQFSRRSGVGGALAAVAGSYAPVALLGAAAWTHAELVLHVAAAHGQDPADQGRAADVLLLTRVHSTRADAEAALAAARQPGARLQSGLPPVRKFGGRLATQAGRWLAIRAVNRLLPGTAVLVATLGSRSAAEALGVRAITFYQQKQAE
jgi:hypothetical protein